jgi:hypothetical protein
MHKLIAKGIAVFIFSSTFLKAQTDDNSIYLKANASLIPLAIINFGAEKQISNHFTLQSDITISPWKSFMGNKMLVGLLFVESRYYFKEAFNGFYVGANIGGGTFRLTKWNYAGTPNYQKGFNYMLGAVVGYQIPLNDKVGLDIFVGGGNSQGFYKGYKSDTGERYDEAKKYNKSGEWIPYRGGVMLTYKLD